MAVEEVAHPGKNDQARRGIQARGPGNDGFRVHDIVRISLHYEPGTIRRGGCQGIEQLERRRNRDQSRRRSLQCQAQRHIAAERESRNDQRFAGPTQFAPRSNCVGVRNFSDALVVCPGACAHAAKIEAHSCHAGITQSPRQRRHDLVFHGAAIQRMRMANHRVTWAAGITRVLDDRLQNARGTCYAKKFIQSQSDRRRRPRSRPEG